MTFSTTEKQQILQIITNLDSKNKKIPYLQDLQKHPMFWSFFEWFDMEQQRAYNQISREYMEEKIKWLTTKWGEFFRRFYALNKDDFWEFRELNEDQWYTDSEEFQEIGKKLQQELFKYENMLTSNMTKRWYALDKVVSAYYDIVHSFFPWFSFVN